MLRARARSEHGAAAVIAVGALALLAAVGVVTSDTVFSGLQGTGGDLKGKRAFAAAEAGLETATNRQSAVLYDTTAPCLSVSLAGKLTRSTAAGNGWCPVVSETYSDDSAAKYWVDQPKVVKTEHGQFVLSTTVVAEGTFAGRTRRVRAKAQAATGLVLFGDAGLSSLDDLLLEGDVAVDADVRSNSKINVQGSVNLCGANGGSATPGPGQAVGIGGSAQVCGSTTPATTPFVMPPVDQGDVATKNDNDKIYCGFSSQTPAPGSARGCDVTDKPNQISWNPTTRSLTMTGGTLTLTGGTYSLCRLDMSGQSELAAKAADTEIYFDSPENCGQSKGVSQLSMTGHSQIRNTTTNPTKFRMFFMGSDTIDTNISMAGGSGAQEMLIYAPRSSIEIAGGTTLLGAVAGKKITMKGQSSFTWDARVKDVDAAVVNSFERSQFVECARARGATPDVGC